MRKDRYVKRLQLLSCGILAIACFIGSCIGCTTLKYTAPIVVRDGITTGGETFELKKRFVLTKVTGFKIKKDSNGVVEASFDTVENADSKAVDALADFAKVAMTMAMATKAP